MYMAPEVMSLPDVPSLDPIYSFTGTLISLAARTSRSFADQPENVYLTVGKVGENIFFSPLQSSTRKIPILDSALTSEAS